MQLDRAPVQLARDDDAGPAAHDRTAAILTLVGCAATLLASILPWGERAAFGFSLTTSQDGNARVLLAVLAVASAGFAASVILRHPATAWTAIVLLGLAVAQVGAAIWFGVSVVNEIRSTHPYLGFISAIGTGVYVAALGSVSTLCGAMLAWRRRQTG
jgi:hypothetical protein